MKRILMAAALLVFGAPAYAQFGNVGGLSGALGKAKQAKDAVDELTITDAEERQIGEDVSEKIRARFGVVQDPAIHKYVTLLGMTLAKASERPNLNWTFVVLDTDGVNAFASPGGIVHVTRGALALASNEAELAGVLGHEIGHVVHKHTVNAIKKSKAVQMGANATRSSVISNFANNAYNKIIENDFDRGDELDADKVGVQLAQKAGYAQSALGDFLAKLDERNKSQAERNGLFASHPQTKERIDKIKAMGNAQTAVRVEARFKSNVKYQLAPLTGLPTTDDASAIAANKKKSLGSTLTSTVAPEKQSAQVSASGGARGLGADRAAKGGDNPNVVRVSVSAGEIDTFKKGIA